MTLPSNKPKGVRIHRPEPEIRWRTYSRITPGEYYAYCGWAKHYRDPAFRRWTCLIRWDVCTDDLLNVIACVPMWLSLGNKADPRASRRGNYLKEWVRANDGPPARDDRLSPRVFTRRFARVVIGDTDAERSPIPYSVVRRILSWETGANLRQSVSKSHSQGRQH